VFDESGTSSIWISEAGTVGSEVPRVEMGRLEGTRSQVTVAGLLPAGVTKVTPRYAAGRASHPLQTAVLRDADGAAGRYTGFFAQFVDEKPRQTPSPWLTGISWTDASGHRQEATLR
jgi:hypothetical protein